MTQGSERERHRTQARSWVVSFVHIEPIRSKILAAIDDADRIEELEVFLSATGLFGRFDKWRGSDQARALTGERSSQMPQAFEHDSTEKEETPNRSQGSQGTNRDE